MLIILLTLSLAFPFLYKYSFVITNQFSQIPIILSFLDPNYLQNDWYVNVSKSFGPRTIFAWYIAQTAKMFSLPGAFFLHYLLYIFLTTIAIYKLTYLIFKQKFVALSTTICILFGTTISLGGNMLMTRDFTAPQLSLGFALFATNLLLERKYLLSSMFFSLASYFHPLIGFESAYLFFTATFLALILSEKSVKRIVTYGVFPFTLFSLPVIYLYLTEGVKSNIPSATKIAILAFMRNPHHYVPSSFPIIHYLQFFILLVFFVITLLILRKTIDKFFFNFLYSSVTIILFLCLIGFIGTEIIPLYPAVVLQPFRLTLFVYWITIVVIFGGIFYLTLRNPKLCPLLFLPILLNDPSYFSSFSKTKILASFIGLSLIIFYKKIPKKFFIFFLLVFFSLLRIHDRFNFFSYINFPTEETRVALWVKNNTPADSIFLVPPEFETFRLVANRAIVVDWKAFPFQEKAMLEWANRICNVGNINPCNYKKVTQEKVVKGYRTVTEDKILELAKKYDINYIITDVNYPSFKKIYNKNNKFYAYEITKSY